MDGRESSCSEVDKLDCSSFSLWVVFSYLNGRTLLFSLKSNTLRGMEYFGWHYSGTDRRSSYWGHLLCLLYSSPSKQTSWWFYLFIFNQCCIVHSLMLMFYYNLQFFLMYCCLTSYFFMSEFILSCPKCVIFPCLHLYSSYRILWLGSSDFVSRMVKGAFYLFWT